jgi:squalene-hopene/tetraprenyl-beta-curcumene cyclase
VTVAAPVAAPQRAVAMAALERARRHVLELQDSSGCWRSGEYTQVGIDAEDVLYREFAGIRTSELSAAAARWIRSRQEADGSWLGRQSAGGDLTVSVLAYTALRLAGDSPDAYHMALAAGWIRDAGGLTSVGVRARVWLAAFGQAEWEDLLVPPPEAIYLPASRPMRLAGQPEWGRPTLVPLAVLGAMRPARGLPFRLAELQVAADGRAREAAAATVSGLPGVDRGLRAYGRSLHVAPLGAARAAALRKCGDWIVAAQSQDGSWRGGRSGWLFSMMALELLGRRPGDPVLRRGLAALDAAARWEEGEAPARRLEFRPASAARTALAVSALGNAGLARDHRALVGAAVWLIEEELSIRSRWLAGRFEPSPGEAAESSGVPTGIEETAAVVLALRKVSLAAASGQLPTTTFALRWLAGLQRKDGGWGRLASGPGSALVTRVPLFDAGGQRDASSPEMTACAVRALAAAGQPGCRSIRRGVAWLLRAQLPDGSWPGEHETGDLLATAAVLLALIAAGVLAGKPPVARAIGWLLARQNADGGWAYPMHGTFRPSGPEGPVPSAPLPTARALIALLAAGGQGAMDAAQRAAAFLVASQRPDGTWTAAPPSPADRPVKNGRKQSQRAQDRATAEPCEALEVDIAAVSALGQYLASGAARFCEAGRGTSGQC